MNESDSSARPRREFLKSAVTKAAAGAAVLAAGGYGIRRHLSSGDPTDRAPANRPAKCAEPPLLRTEPAVAPAFDSPEVAHARWHNWTRNVIANPQTVKRPANLEELQRVVVESCRLRALGTGHSISAIAKTDDTLLVTNDLNKFIWLDRERMRVKVEAGIKLAEFSEKLAEWGFALPSTGDTNYQSLAGLLSTGTHGSGMKWGSCSDEDSLLGMELVLADGSLLKLDRDNPADQELLKAARVGLGALGVIYSVTMSIVPLHNLEHFSRKGTLQEALDPRHWHENDHYEFSFFPYTPKKTCYMFFRNKTTKAPNTTRLGDWLHRNFLENDVAHALLGATVGNPAILPGVMRDFAAVLPKMHEIDRCDRIMTIPRTNPAFLFEYSIPITQLTEAQRAYEDLVEEFANKANPAERFYQNLPTQVRFIRADRGTYLSHAADRDSCYFGVGSDIRHRGQEPFFRALEERWLPLGARPHWGKVFYRNPKGLYPEWEKYLAVRNRLDPSGKFMNEYMNRLSLGYSF